MVIVLQITVARVSFISYISSMNKTHTFNQEDQMTFAEIKKILDDAGAEYTVHGRQYIQVTAQGACTQVDFPEDQTASLAQHEGDFLVIDRAFEDEQDIADVKSFCGLYIGQ